ncbi:MAG: hypothetical protein J6X83_03240, partial [Methanomicrobium sp.]|nr:hypothetical protein [Methanomicrobium sp.]
ALRFKRLLSWKSTATIWSVAPSHATYRDVPEPDTAIFDGSSGTTTLRPATSVIVIVALSVCVSVPVASGAAVAVWVAAAVADPPALPEPDVQPAKAIAASMAIMIKIVNAFFIV